MATQPQDLLPAKDLLGWYNAEITRYRNLEWQITGYAAAMMVAILYLVADDKKHEVFDRHPFLTVLALVGLVIVSGWLSRSERHLHLRLNDYRAMRQDLLAKARKGEDYLSSIEKKAEKGWFLRNARGGVDSTDIFYVVGFQAIIACNGILAFILLVLRVRPLLCR